MDLDRRSGGVPHLSAKSDLERGERFPLRATDAKHQGRRPRCGALALAVLCAAGPAYQSVDGIHLDHGWAGVAVRPAFPALPFPGMGVRGGAHDLHRTAWEELLPRA